MSIHFSLPSSTDQPISLLDDGACGMPVDSHPGRRAQCLFEYPRKSERRPGHRSFADFLAGLVRKRLAGEPLPPVPKSTS
jgi:hypothetical protein